jgi:ABC-type antimicrobial peptide transport system permease subunit
MVKNFFKFSIRNLVKNRLTSFVNIMGLSVGMAGAILIFLWVQNEFSYDQFHENKENLYKVWNRTPASLNGPINCWPAMAPPVGPVLKQQFPEVKATTRYDGPEGLVCNYADKAIVVQSADVDPAFLSMFSFPLVEGNREKALNESNSMVLTVSVAKRIFGDEDPMGKTVKLNGKESYRVTGLLRDLPNNTEFKFDCLVPVSDFDRFDANSWSDHKFLTYIQLQEGSSLERFNQRIKNLVVDHAPRAQVEIFAQPSSQWHLYSNFENGKVAGGPIENVRQVFIIACLILLIACINFMNLATAQSEKRAREVGVRKVIGATKSRLIRQFLGESIFIAGIAGLISLVLVKTSLHAFNLLVSQNLEIGYGSSLFWMKGLGFILFAGLLAGSYPAFFLSTFRPVMVLKANKGKTNAINVRKLLVVAQFTLAIVLIISTLVINQQLQWIQQRDNGYERNNLVEHRITGDIGKNYELIKNELLSSGCATSVCKTGLAITMNNGSDLGFQWGNQDPEQKRVRFSEFATTGNFVHTMGLKLISGRDIDLSLYPSDSASILINETAVTVTGLIHPIGQRIKAGGQNLTIVGVIKDFINGSPDQRIEPMIIFGSKYWHNNLAFRLNGQNPVSKNMQLAEGIFKKYNPGYPFNYEFADEAYRQKFQEDIRASMLSGIFAGLSIFISCLGLFGVAAHISENRTKEIGIRKVLGASIASVVKLMTKEFLMLVILSFLIAAPLGWWTMNKWLQGFTYRINIGWLSFLIAGSLAATIAVLTVSFHALKAAISNPVTAIRTVD